MSLCFAYLVILYICFGIFDILIENESYIFQNYQFPFFFATKKNTLMMPLIYYMAIAITNHNTVHTL